MADQIAVLDIESVEARARRLFSNLLFDSSVGEVNFVGTDRDRNTIATLAETYSSGTDLYEQYWTCRGLRSLGYSVKEIADETGYPLEKVRHVVNRDVEPYSISGTNKAQSYGIIPLNYRNPRIDDLHRLLALNFWTGSLTHGMMDFSLRRDQTTSFRQVLINLGMKRAKDVKDYRHEFHFHENEGHFTIRTTAMTRTMALLGLPHYAGGKGANPGLKVPWYVKFLFTPEEFGLRGQHNIPDEMKRARYIYLGALLTEKFQSCHFKQYPYQINIMAAHTQDIGQNIARTTADMIAQAIPGFDMHSVAIGCPKRPTSEFGSNSYKPVIRLDQSHADAILYTLSEVAQRAPTKRYSTKDKVNQLAKHALYRRIHV